ncbi:MAG: ATP-binding protein [Ignavibacteriales bacterium]|nr:ATP-binding protein [Ignavibacteriales bacterium]
MMEDLSLHILDIAENSVNAGARNISIVIQEDVHLDRLTIEIGDDGKGMSAEVAQRATDPFYTTRTTRRIGMGLPLLKEAAEMANGKLEIRSVPNSGTTIKATFQLSNIDRKPLGNMAETITALLATEHQVNILYRHSRGGKNVTFDSKHVENQLGDILLNSIEALSLVRTYLEQEESSLAQ